MFVPGTFDKGYLPSRLITDPHGGKSFIVNCQRKNRSKLGKTVMDDKFVKQHLNSWLS